MNTSEKNSYLIIYVLLDFVRYVKELEKAATTEEEQKRIHEPVSYTHLTLPTTPYV